MSRRETDTGAGADASGRERDRGTALYVAMVVRNALENFHARHLSDAQMRELNPILRDAIYTALRATKEAPSSPGAASFVHFQTNMIPEYWEEPELLDDYVKTLRMFDAPVDEDRRE